MGITLNNGSSRRRSSRNSAFQKQIKEQEKRRSGGGSSSPSRDSTGATGRVVVKDGRVIAGGSATELSREEALKIAGRGSSTTKKTVSVASLSQKTKEQTQTAPPTRTPTVAPNKRIDGTISAAPNNRFIPDFIEQPARKFGAGIKQGFLDPATAAKELRAEQTSGFTEAGQVIGFVGGMATAAVGGAPGVGAKAVTTAKTGLGTAGRAAQTALPAGRAAQAKSALDAANKARKATATAAAKAKAAVQAANASPVGRFIERSGLKGLGVVTAQGVAGSAATKQVARSTRKDELPAGITNKQFEKATAAALKTASEPDKQGLAGLGQSVAAGLNPIFINEQRFRAAAREEFKARGLTGEALNLAVNRAEKERQTILAPGEALTLVNVARATEAQGRRLVAGAFDRAAKKGVTMTRQTAFWNTFKLTAPQIAKAGVAEGTASVLAQDIVRGQDINAKKLAIGGAVGGVSAGLIGGTIAGSRINKPTVSKAIEFGAFITDPFEKPGDLLQDATEAVAKRAFGKTSPQPTIVASVNPSDFMSFGVTQPAGKGSKAKSSKSTGKRKAGTNNNLPNFVGIPASAPVLSPVNIPTFDDTPKAPTSPFTVTKTNQGVPNPVPTPPINTNPNIPVLNPTQTPINQPVDVPVNVPANVPININIPTASPMLRVPPPLPFAFPAGSSSGTSTKGKRKKFVNELAAGQEFLAGFGLNVAPQRKQAKKAIKKSGKSKGKLVKDPLDPFGVFNGGGFFGL